MGAYDIAYSERGKVAVFLGKRGIHRRWGFGTHTDASACPPAEFDSDHLLLAMLAKYGDVTVTIDDAVPMNYFGKPGEPDGWPWDPHNDPNSDWVHVDYDRDPHAVEARMGRGFVTEMSLRRALESKTMRAPTSAALPVTAALVEALGGQEATDAAAMANGYPGIIIYGGKRPDTCDCPGCNVEYDADVVCGDDKWRVCEEHCDWIPERLSAELKARSETHETT